MLSVGNSLAVEGQVEFMLKQSFCLVNSAIQDVRLDFGVCAFQFSWDRMQHDRWWARVWWLLLRWAYAPARALALGMTVAFAQTRLPREEAPLQVWGSRGAWGLILGLEQGRGRRCVPGEKLCCQVQELQEWVSNLCSIRDDHKRKTEKGTFPSLTHYGPKRIMRSKSSFSLSP